MYSMDLLRIVSMCGVVSLHLLGQGGILFVADDPRHYAMGWFLEICAYCSVNLFAMLSGYLSSGKKSFSAMRMIELVACTLLYSTLITGIFYGLNPAVFYDKRQILNGILPALDGRYWYITCFIPLMILEPFFNAFLAQLTVRQHRNLLLLLLLIFSVVPSVIMVDLFETANGYSFLWLSICYILGAYLRRVKEPRFCTSMYVVVYFGSAIFLLVGNLFAYWTFGGNPQYLISYTSPVVVVMGICVFRVFQRICNERIPHWMQRVLPTLAAVSFDVYILHAHIFVYDYVIEGCFSWALAVPAIWMPVLLIGAVMLLYLVLAAIGLVRMKLFECLKRGPVLRLVDKLSYKL